MKEEFSCRPHRTTPRMERAQWFFFNNAVCYFLLILSSLSLALMQQVDTMPLGACVKLNGEEPETSLAGASDLLRWVPDKSDLAPSHRLR